MPRRITNVRASHRPLAESKDPTWKTADESYTHTRWLMLKSLAPLSGDEARRVSRAGYEADWRAICRATPEVHDGDRLVTFVDGSVELILYVEKKLRRGRRQELLLREDHEVQS